ncbi:VOC family protein [Hoyosella subflava]|uniref:Conserved protein n=1 Tax=Hoyosella subflava (strain DSM 45089 / JCM 17490 / NBRC 109087 / DQS3-9A1) TaxID=443218 RepID=F6EQM7_HOYSD|nr:VOC family protein [Hoyosella subflava]AEF41904.1 Conserved protein [Hoyosella subflava DQS3-9A1]
MAKIETVYPRLVVSDGAAAIGFYVKALGAEERCRYTDNDGRIVHSEVVIGGVTVAVKDADGTDPSPDNVNGTPVILALYTDDAKAVADRMMEHGATVIFPVRDQFYGERAGRLADPFGHVWMVAQKSGDLSPDEIQRTLTG